MPYSPHTPSYLRLHHGWPLSTEHLDGLEQVDHSLVPHPLQNNAQGDEHTSPPNTSTNSHTLLNPYYKSLINIRLTHTHVKDKST